jgi:hypothetical protein
MTARVFLGHGASGTAASMRPFVDGLAARGVPATAVDLPRRRAEAAVSAWLAAVPPAPGVIVGGHSYGGRVASLAAAEVASLAAAGSPMEAASSGYAGVVLFSYPLHPPGAPDRAVARAAHWPAIGVPVLLLSGGSDPFARLDLLRSAVRSLPDAELVTYPRLGHGLRPVLDDVLDRVAAFVRRIGA